MWDSTLHIPKGMKHPSVLFCLFIGAFFFGIGLEGGGATLFGIIWLMTAFMFFARERIFFLIGIIGFLSGALIMHASWESHERNTLTLVRTLDTTGWKPVSIGGTVREYMSHRDNTLRYRLDHLTIAWNTLPHDISVFLAIPENLTLSIGEHITFRGKITLLEDSETFSYSKYGWIHDTYGETRIATFTRGGSEKRSIIQRVLEEVRDAVIHSTRSLFPYEVRAIALGMTIGNTRYFTETMKTHFSQSGLSHLVAVSGSNMTLVILFLSLFLRFFPIGKYGRIAIIAIGIIVYCAIVGWNIPAVRAGCMGILGYIALTNGRKFRPLPLLFATAIWFVLLEPMTLLYDVSFQLSFMAVWWLILFRETLERWTINIPNFLELRSACIVTLSATLATLPITLANFGTFPTLSLFANLLVAPLVALATITGAMSIGIALLSHTLGFLFGFIPYTLFSVILLVSEKIGSLEWSVIPLEFLPFYRHYILFGVLFIVTWVSIEYTYERQFSRENHLQK